MNDELQTSAGSPEHPPSDEDSVTAAAPARTDSDSGPPAAADPKTELDEARAQAAAYLDDLKRLKAEFENYRKRILREQTGLVERAAEQMVERLLPVLDNFELALLAADRTTDPASLARGVEMVFGDLLDILHGEGLRKIDALGQPFDPAMHEAVLQEDGGEGDAVVVDVLRPGYVLRERVVRPAMVKVGRR